MTLGEPTGRTAEALQASSCRPRLCWRSSTEESRNSAVRDGTALAELDPALRRVAFERGGGSPVRHNCLRDAVRIGLRQRAFRGRGPTSLLKVTVHAVHKQFRVRRPLGLPLGVGQLLQQVALVCQTLIKIGALEVKVAKQLVETVRGLLVRRDPSVRRRPFRRRLRQFREGRLE